MQVKCNSCFEDFEDEYELCPYCGYEPGSPAREPYFLFPGTLLNSRYIFGEVLGFGGFGITYKAWDKYLGVKVAIKEYYYSGIVTRVPGTTEILLFSQNRKAEFDHFLSRFLDEARNTAKFFAHKNIVNVYEFFEANNTAYMVMEYLEGMSVSEYMKQGLLEPGRSLEVIQCVCAALKAVHAAGIIHRDVSPDNIFLCNSGTVKLIDFGAARFSKTETFEVSKLTTVLKPGFSPPEQYQSISEQSSLTDIYALGATLYFMVTGSKPEESTNRIEKDLLIPPITLKPELPEYLNDTILRAMALDMHLRFHSVEDFEKALNREKKVLPVAQEKKRRKVRRLASIAAAVLVAITGLTVFFVNFTKEKEAETLPDTSFELWYAQTGSVTGESEKDQAFREIIRVFNESFANVTITLKPMDAKTYSSKIVSAIKNSSLPPLFESSGLTGSQLKGAVDMSGVVSSVAPGECLFLDRYDVLFPLKNQLPLGFNAPVFYQNTAVKTNGSSTGSTSDREKFLSGFLAEYHGSTADFTEVMKALPARYKLMPDKGSDSYSNFENLWSIGKCNSDQQKAIERLLLFLLSDNAQDIYHVRFHSGYVPLNKNALELYCDVYSDFEGFFKDAGAYRFRPVN